MKFVRSFGQSEGNRFVSRSTDYVLLLLLKQENSFVRQLNSTGELKPELLKVVWNFIDLTVRYD